MKLMKRLAVMIMTLIVGSSSVMAFEIPKIEDTFTYSNIGNTFGETNQAFYMITSTNGVKAIGNGIVGAKETNVDSKTWIDIVKDISGTQIDSIVAINASYYGISLLDNEGNVYLIKDSGLPKKVEGIPKIKKVSSNVAPDRYHANQNDTWFGLGVDNKVYNLLSPGTIVELSTGKEAIDIFDSTQKREYATCIDNEGMLYVYYPNDNKFKPFVTQGDSNLTNVKTLKPLNYSETAVVTNNGKLMIVNLANGAYNYIQFQDESGNMVNPYVYNVITTDGVEDANIKVWVDTSMGYFEINNYNTLVAKPLKLDYRPVKIAKTINETSYSVLDDLGYIHTIGASPIGINGKVIREDWMNSNPIVKDSLLANVEIENDSVMDRESEYSIKFNLVSEREPKGFNIYYSKYKDSAIKDNWKLIEENVTVSGLTVEEYDTGYVDSSNEKILGKSYIYKWRPEKVDLTNIQVIVEPIY